MPSPVSVEYLLGVTDALLAQREARDKAFRDLPEFSEGMDLDQLLPIAGVVRAELRRARAEYREAGKHLERVEIKYFQAESLIRELSGLDHTDFDESEDYDEHC